jgi:Multimeric flavodoxin WrbA
MRIVIINGSPRKNGITAKILKEFRSQLSGFEDVDVDYYDISDQNITTCKGCQNCYRTGECFINDDAETLSIKLGQADGIIIGTPNYVSNISGELKIFVDRGHFVMEQLLKDKKAVTVVTYENADGRSVQKILSKLMIYSGATICGRILIKISRNGDPLAVDAVNRKIKRFSKNLVTSIEKKKRGNILQNIRHSVVFRVGIRPIVLKDRDHFNGVLLHWKERRIV